MQKTTFTELRKNAKTYFDAVESGQIVRIYRRGKPIADIVPVARKTPSWKRKLPGITVRGVSLTEEILADRDNAGS